MSLIKFENFEVDTLNEDGSLWDGSGDAWFIPKQIAEALSASNPRKYANELIRKNFERFEGFSVGCKLRSTDGKSYDTNIINENGLYIFLMASNLPQAISFQRQVSEMIKKIRKDKIQVFKSIPQNYKEAVAALLGQLEENDKLQEEIQEQKPKVQIYHRMIDAESNQTFNEVAKSLKIGRNKMLKILRDKKFLMWNNLPYQKYLESNHFFVREVTKNGKNFTQTLVTAKGLDLLGRLFISSKEVIKV
ncbi:phage antirepressor KilAC domain-containing protein [Paenibacillus donghaensis]|uniref:Bro-N domain-containing protein n=1 Tax=Paenibacillus donghaensis TaxID=414771 RepID=A0A2Z2KNJ5_9BACL|nr:phage antirepressor KilAC domain-containing protein [Paenibacillus donghaensis]ASA22772.1 hypothetical protein B9T62_19385 [Paenibacillus donghaensis]